MIDVLTAELAELFDFESVGIVSLVLHRGVVATFASAASQCDDDSVLFLCHFSNS